MYCYVRLICLISVSSTNQRAVTEQKSNIIHTSICHHIKDKRYFRREEIVSLLYAPSLSMSLVRDYDNMLIMLVQMTGEGIQRHEPKSQCAAQKFKCNYVKTISKPKTTQL